MGSKNRPRSVTERAVKRVYHWLSGKCSRPRTGKKKSLKRPFRFIDFLAPVNETLLRHNETIGHSLARDPSRQLSVPGKIRGAANCFAQLIFSFRRVAERCLRVADGRAPHAAAARWRAEGARPALQPAGPARPAPAPSTPGELARWHCRRDKGNSASSLQTTLDVLYAP